MLGRLKPKNYNSFFCPQIRYPDYGIDIAKLGDLIAFKAAISLLKNTQEGREKFKKYINHVKIY